MNTAVPNPQAHDMGIRSGAPVRPAPGEGHADPTHGSYDSQAFLQSEIGRLQHWEG